MLLSMIVVITSWAPVLARSQPGTPPQMAPPSAAATSTIGRRMTAGRSKVNPTHSPAMPPMRIWPSVPMLKSPARKPIATDSPPRISGEAAVKVSETARSEPNDPSKRAMEASRASRSVLPRASPPRLRHSSMSVTTMMTPETMSAVRIASAGTSTAVRQSTSMPDSSSRNRRPLVRSGGGAPSGTSGGGERSLTDGRLPPYTGRCRPP